MLTSTSREECDHSSCPAQGQVAYVSGILELVFCQHHANDLHGILECRGFELVAAPESPQSIKIPEKS